MSVVHEELEAALEDAGWLAGEWHHLRLPGGREAFGFGRRGAAPWVEASPEGAGFVAVTRSVDGAAPRAQSFRSPGMMQWRARLPAEKRMLIGPQD
jgi:hypothetical protein